MDGDTNRLHHQEEVTMKLCSGEGVFRHSQIAFDEAIERGICPFCRTAMNERMMRDTLISFSNGQLSVGSLFTRLANSGLFFRIPDDMQDHPLMAMKLTREAAKV